MDAATRIASTPSESLQIRVFGPDNHPKGPCITAMCGDAIVGTASYRLADTELRVTDFDIADTSGCRRDDIVCALLDALELACLAGGWDRLVFRVPQIVSPAFLQLRGYVVTNGCEGRWAEKSYRRMERPCRKSGSGA